MKITSKTTTANGANRISALKRLSKPSSGNSIHHRLSAPATPVITDARQLLTNRNKPVFDARQLLSRKASDTSLTTRNNIMAMDDEEEEDDDDDDDDDNHQPAFITNSKGGRLNSGIANRNANTIEPISFTKTITNTSFIRKDDNRYSQTSNIQSSSSDQKVVISFLNDQYRKRPKSPSPPPPPPPARTIRRAHDASMQTIHSSRSPIRINSHRKYLEDQYEPPTKRSSTRTDKEQQVLPSSSKISLKRTSTDVSVSTRPKPTSSVRSNVDDKTVLITNLQSSVTEDDVIELFSEVGDINDIKTLSRGCVQIVYSRQEQAEDAVAKYHNQLLDGKLMYVSLQPSTSRGTKSLKHSSSQHSKGTTAKDNYSSSSSSSSNTNQLLQSNSNKITIDPAFIRQALFNPTNNTANAVQFQVKL